MAFEVRLAPDNVFPGDVVFISISGGTPGAAFTAQFVNDISFASGLLDEAGNALFPFTVEATRSLGDWVVRAVTTQPGELDEATLVVQSALLAARPIMVIEAYTIPKFGRNINGSAHAWSLTAKNQGLATGEVTLFYFRNGSEANQGTFTLAVGETHEFSANMANITEFEAWRCQTKIAGVAQYDVKIQALITGGNDPSPIDDVYQNTFNLFVTPGGGGGGGIPPGYHVPEVGENPNIVYPVDQFRNAQDILQALVDSGQWLNLGPTEQNGAFAAPQNYLETHFLLNQAYPAFFNIKTTASPINLEIVGFDTVLDKDLAKAATIFPKPSAAPVDPLTNIQAFFDTAMRPIMGAVSAQLESLISTGGPVNPNNALATALAVALKGLGAGFSIYTLATATDLLHPLKGTGIIPTAINIVDGLGTNIFGRTIVGSYSEAFVDDPLKMFFRSKARPWRPKGTLADQMYFQGQILEDEWVSYKKFEGIPDDLIVKYFASMFTEPSDRLLVSALEDPGTDPAWLARKVKARGFNEEDANILLAALERRAQDKLRVDRGTEVITRIKEGFVTPEQGRAELLVLGNRPDQADRIIQLAILKRDSEFRRDSLAVVSTAFAKDVLTVEELIDQLALYLEDPAAQQTFLNLQLLKKLPKARDVPVKTAALIAQEEAEKAAREQAREEARQAQELLDLEEAAARASAAEAAKVQAALVQARILEFRKGLASTVQLETRLVELGVPAELAKALVELENVRSIAT